jgi:wyosine [tRNA(Phe)-imidazoG37] synthetase (radical SAM superfamily)
MVNRIGRGIMSEQNNKFISCDWLEHGIIFDHENIVRVCCSQCNEGGGRPVLWGDYNGEPINWDNFFAQKREMRDIQRTGETYSKCKGCILLHEDEWDEDNCIDRLLLTHWINCNCKCIYCPAIRDEELKAHNKHYNIVPVLKDMCERNLLRKHAYISIAGGESTIYPEFEDMLNILLDYGCDNILINSSGIKFSEAIAKGLSERKLQLTISVDSGTKETYEKIKLVKTYDIVCENLRQYAIAQGEDKDRVCSKYIIVPSYNDDECEIELWLKKTKEIGIKHASIDIDWRWVQQNLDRLKQERRIYELIVFTKKIADREDLFLRYDERASIMRRIHKESTAVFGGTMKKMKD